MSIDALTSFLAWALVFNSFRPGWTAFAGDGSDFAPMDDKTALTTTMSASCIP